MKKLSLLLICLMLLSTIAYANELTGDVSEIQEKPTVTPGKFTWGIQRFIERIKMITTFGAENKAEYGLQLAEKRLAEIQELAASNDTTNIETAKEEYQKQIEQIKQQIANLKDTNKDKELQKLTIMEGRLLKFEDNIQRVQSFIDTKTNLTEDQQGKLNDILEQLKEKDEELKEKLDERQNSTLEKLNLTEDELQQKIQEIKAQYNITAIKQELIQRDIERLKAKQENLREIATRQQEKGKNVDILLQRLNAVDANLAQIQASTSLSPEERKDLLKETQQLLNFRQVYRSNGTKDIEELKQKIQEKTKERQEASKLIKGTIKELKEQLSGIHKESISEEPKENETENENEQPEYTGINQTQPTNTVNNTI